MLSSTLLAPADTAPSAVPVAAMLESPFDRVVALAQRLLDVPMVYVTHAEHDRLVFQSCIGLEGGSVSREAALCAHTLRVNEVVVCEDALLDPRFTGHPLVTGTPGIRFYAGVPLRSPEGFAVGTFCLAAPSPRVLSPDELQTFLDLGEIAASIQQLRHGLRQHDETTELLRTALEDAGHQLEHIAEAFVSIDPEWTITYVNPQALRATGLAWYELAGHNVWTRFPGASQTLFHAELHRAMRDQVRVAVEDRYGARWYRMKAVPHRKGLSVLVSDVTERREAETALRRSEERFRLLIEHLSDIVCVMDATGTITFISPSCSRVMGQSAEELIGRNVFDFLHPDDLEATTAAFRRCAEQPGVAPPVDFRWRQPDDSHVHLEAIGNNLLDEPALRGIVVTSRDATERRMVLETLHRSLEKERVVNELKSGFVAMASHEFRTPLATILSSAQLAERLMSRSHEKAEKHLHRIDTTVRAMLGLLDDILALERVGAGEAQDTEAIDLPALLADMFDDLQVGVGANHRLRLTGTVPPVMHTNRMTLRLMLSNLFTNAIKYSAPGTEVVLDVSRPEPGAPVVTFRVTDHGIGIPAHEVALLFEPFHRAGNVGTIPGTGLGLSMVKRTMDRCGGTIDVQSVEGQGTTVEVMMPLTQRPR